MRWLPMKQGEPLSPYRNFLAEAEQNLETERSVLGARAATLGALRPLLPRGLRRELTRLERAIQRPVQNAHDVELARQSLDAYAEQVDVAIAFSDHVARDRAMTRRRLRSWLSWGFGAGAAVTLFVALMLVRDLSQPPPAPTVECTLTECMITGECVLGTQSPMSDIAPTAPNTCGLSSECAQEGRCNTAPEGCYAASDADCAASWACKLDGRCRAEDGICSNPVPAASGPLPATGAIAGNGTGLH